MAREIPDEERRSGKDMDFENGRPVTKDDTDEDEDDDEDDEA